MSKNHLLFCAVSLFVATSVGCLPRGTPQVAVSVRPVEEDKPPPQQDLTARPESQDRSDQSEQERGWEWPEGLSGPYLGQSLPGDEPRIFAPGLVSTGLSERDVAITPDGREFYFCASIGSFAVATILVSRLTDEGWSAPEVVPFASPYLDFEPAISVDGSQLFFLSTRPGDGPDSRPGNQDIWVVDRVGDGWSEPRNLGPPVNSELPEFYPSPTADGTLYFTRQAEDRSSAIYRSRMVDGVYQEPERLPEQVNSGAGQFNAFVAADESYIIVPVQGREDSIGGVDYYVSFRSEDDRWSDPINMGPKINQATGREWSSYVTRDGKYLFFMSSQRTDDGPPGTFRDMQQLNTQPGNGNPDIWWVDASLIDALKPDGF